MFAGILLYGFVGASSYLLYRLLVPSRPLWDRVLWGYPLVTLTDAVALYVPAGVWLLVYVLVSARYLGLQDRDR